MRVFDFDNTIYDGESGLDIFLFYLKKEPKLIARRSTSYVRTSELQRRRNKKENESKKEN